MSKKQTILLSITFFLTGVVFGFLLAPIKQGIGNNCGNNYNYYKDKEEENTNHENTNEE